MSWCNNTNYFEWECVRARCVPCVSSSEANRRTVIPLFIIIVINLIEFPIKVHFVQFLPMPQPRFINRTNSKRRQQPTANNNRTSFETTFLLLLLLIFLMGARDTLQTHRYGISVSSVLFRRCVGVKRIEHSICLVCWAHDWDGELAIPSKVPFSFSDYEPNCTDWTLLINTHCTSRSQNTKRAIPATLILAFRKYKRKKTSNKCEGENSVVLMTSILTHIHPKTEREKKCTIAYTHTLHMHLYGRSTIFHLLYGVQ